MDFFSTFGQLEGSLFWLFVMCMIAICFFEFVNGFHDTANAVATVIYTKSLKPQIAVVLSGVLNFLGVIFSNYLFGMGVAVGIIKLLPLGEMMNIGIYENVAIVGSVVIAAIIWNLGTWYFGIPCSSSHTLVGSLLGAGLGYQLIHKGDGVNWSKAGDIGMSLLLSPAFGFTMAIILMYMAQRVLKKKDLFKPNNPGAPPFKTRALLIGTCSLVSFFHGSNDGQKGLGLMMIILMTFMPLQFSLNEKFGDTQTIEHLDNIQKILTNYKTSSPLEKEFNNTISNIDILKTDIYNNNDSTAKQKFEIRKRIQVITKSLEIIVKDPEFLPNKSLRDEIKSEIKFMKSYTDWAPNWAIMLIALSIGIGTMIGWKRIVVTIGEKIGKSHLSYGQGAVSELVAASTIGLSTTLGLPVSTTHVLSSAIAGSMVAKGGVKNLQKNTIKSIAIAWLLTLPVSIILALSFFLLFRLFI